MKRNKRGENDFRERSEIKEIKIILEREAK